jgi:glutamyl-tRNA reductase
MATRGKEAEKAERIVAEEVDRFQKSLLTLDVVPAIVEMQKVFETTRQSETRRMQAKLHSLSPEQKNAVDALTRGLMNKYLHQTLNAMKTAAKDGDAAMVKSICEMYAVDPGMADLVAGRAGSSDPRPVFNEDQERPETKELVELVSAIERED